MISAPRELLLLLRESHQPRALKTMRWIGTIGTGKLVVVTRYACILTLNRAEELLLFFGQITLTMYW